MHFIEWLCIAEATVIGGVFFLEIAFLVQKQRRKGVQAGNGQRGGTGYWGLDTRSLDMEGNHVFDGFKNDADFLG